MVAVDEAIGKVRAAVRARQDLDPNVVLIMRTDALGVGRGDLEEAIARANAYINAGADVVSIEALASVEDLTRAVREVKGRVMYNQSGDGPRLTSDEFRASGVALVILPGAMLRPAIYAMHRYAEDLRRRGTVADVEFAQGTSGHPLADLHALGGIDRVREFERAFLP